MYAALGIQTAFFSMPERIKEEKDKLAAHDDLHSVHTVF